VKIGIIGAGTWGSALAYLLANNGHEVTLFSAIGEEIDELSETRVPKNLPETVLPESIKFTKDIKSASENKELIIFVVPSKYMRSSATLAAKYISPGTIISSASKGIEPGTLKTMTEIIEECLKLENPGADYSYVALSGPTHAEEVAKGLPTSIVAACEDEDVAMRVAEIFSSSCVRAYTNTDVLGVEISGALKNIIALAAGINRGMGYGDNSTAMLITRGIAEITRMGLALGCKRRTFMGLAGIGDLIVTATSRHSRNNRCGELIGSGMSYAEAEKRIGMVVEGYHALEAAMALSKKLCVEMPITEAVYEVINNIKTPKEAMLSLMQRNLKSELDI
jgi:glycerol-3-phosphate dehydrogenase (NAD(P)+)